MEVVVIVVLIIFIIYIIKQFTNRSSDANTVAELQNSNVPENEELYYIYHNNEVEGPHSLNALKRKYLIKRETLITTDTLNGEWFEAQYFECFDGEIERNENIEINEYGEIVKKNAYSINEFGEIVRKK